MLESCTLERQQYLRRAESVPCWQARAVAEFDGARSDLMSHLPAELPSKDLLAGPQPGVAPPEDVVAPPTEDQLVDSLVGLPWEFIINKAARQEWARMDRPFRSHLLSRLHQQCNAQPRAGQRCMS